MMSVCSYVLQRVEEFFASYFASSADLNTKIALKFCTQMHTVIRSAATGRT